VRVILHGSIQRGPWEEPGSWWRRTDPFLNENWFTVFPAAWGDAPWWQYRQVENLEGILRELRREYDLDENRAHLMGLSDGGTGTFFQALKDTTPWASFCPFIGHPNVLNHEASQADGQFYAVNLRNKPLWVANGLEDPLYPAEEVSLYLDLFRRAGARIVYRPQEGGHDVRWWPGEAAQIRAFQDQNPRVALPDTLVWETDRVDRYARAHWLILEELGAVGGEAELVDENVLRLPEGFSPREARAFPRERASGRVELVRSGNHVDARTRGVRRFRLLLSADQFDLDRPIQVEVNGRMAFEGRLSRDATTLFHWAILDEDRRMLFDAELEIAVPETE
jgi:predicted esterase